MAEQTGTRQRILSTATELFRQQGYHATGLTQILNKGDAPKGSLYFHFPGGKEQLGVEAVAAGGGQTRAVLDAVLAYAASPSAALAGIAAALGQALADSGYREGCPVATVALDAASESEPIRVACEESYQSWLDLLADRLVRWGVTVEEAAGLAVLVISAVEGALLLARVRRQTTPLDEVATRLGRLLDTAVQC